LHTVRDSDDLDSSGVRMSYRYRLEDLFLLLREHALAKVDAVSLHHRQVEHGLLSVGLKIHCLADTDRFSELVDGLGGAQRILDINLYRQNSASMCLVVPPAGSAASAIHMLECLEHSVGIRLFNNRNIQLQVCSPGRLDTRRSALLAIGFYLGSDTLRRYNLGDLETSFTTHCNHPRGRRLVLYDADGDFDRDFEWWRGSGSRRLIDRKLPFDGARSDLLAGSASSLDIYNINLLATLLVHSQYEGYWGDLGKQFEAEMEGLLERHLLSGLLNVPWVRTNDPTTFDDCVFFSALQELVAYAWDEARRIEARNLSFLLKTPKNSWARPSSGILEEVQFLLGNYRRALVGQAIMLGSAERT
jgi:hypothetical protein